MYLVIHFACIERWPRVRMYSYIHSQMAWLIGQGLEGKNLENWRQRNLGKRHLDETMEIDKIWRSLYHILTLTEGIYQQPRQQNDSVNWCQPASSIGHLSTGTIVHKCCGRDGSYKEAQTAEVPSDQGWCSYCCCWMSNLPVTENNPEASIWHYPSRRPFSHIVASWIYWIPPI